MGTSASLHKPHELIMILSSHQRQWGWCALVLTQSRSQTFPLFRFWFLEWVWRDVWCSWAVIQLLIAISKTQIMRFSVNADPYYAWVTWANLPKEWTLTDTILRTSIATFTGGASIRTINNLEKKKVVSRVYYPCRLLLSSHSLSHAHTYPRRVLHWQKNHLSLNRVYDEWL